MHAMAKVEAAKRLFAKGRTSREVSKELGYRSPSGLSAMMRRHGYRWDSSAQNYVYSGDGNGEVSGNGTVDVMDLLSTRGEQLEALLQWFETASGSPGEPRMRRVPGPTVTKGFRLPVEVDDQLREFCARNVLSQKDILTTALIEFLERHD